MIAAKNDGSKVMLYLQVENRNKVVHQAGSSYGHSSIQIIRASDSSSRMCLPRSRANVVLLLLGVPRTYRPSEIVRVSIYLQGLMKGFTEILKLSVICEIHVFLSGVAKSENDLLNILSSINEWN